MGFDKVPSHLQTLAPVTSLDLKHLSFKLVTLPAILTGQRCQTIHKFDSYAEITRQVYFCHRRETQTY